MGARSRTSYYVGPRDHITRADLARYEASGDWVAEIKHDGFWDLMEVVKGVVVSMQSRTGGPLMGPLVGRRIGDNTSKWTGLLAGELVCDAVAGEDPDETTRTGTRRLHLFEPLIWNTLDLRDLKLEERRQALEMIIGTFSNTTTATEKPAGALLYIVERRDEGFTAWYDELITNSTSRVIGARPEGLVLKKRGTKGRAVNADGKVDFWLRCKPKNQIDYVVVGADGFAPKGTPKIALGLYKKTKDGVRVVKCMSLSWPSKFSSLKAGDVVEVEGAEVFPSGAVRHGNIKRARPDKPAESCTFEAAVEAK